MVNIRLFGTTRVVTEAGAVAGSALGGVKPRQILEILALAAGTPVPKEQLAELLWDGRPPRCYLGTLESYVCVLRRALGLPKGRGGGIATVLGGYVLDPEALRVDVVDFRSTVRAALATSDDARCLELLEQALAQVSGDLLADEVYATWAIREREAMEREVAEAAGTAAARAEALGRYEVAVRTARIAVQHDPFAEDAWRTLVEALSALGRRPEALRAYAELREVLAEELGTDPHPRTTELYLRVLQGHSVPGAVATRGAHPDVRATGREEVRVLLGLLRQAVQALPGQVVPDSDRALVQLAADLVPA